MVTKRFQQSVVTWSPHAQLGFNKFFIELNCVVLPGGGTGDPCSAGRQATAAHWLLVASPAGRDQSRPPDSGLQQ